MALATKDDVEDALGRPLTPAEDARLAHLLDAASDLVNGYLNWTVPDPVPLPVTRVVADMVAAVYTKPETVTAQYDAGGYNMIREAVDVHVGTESATTTGPWLTKALKTRLASYRTGSSVCVQLVSDRHEDA